MRPARRLQYALLASLGLHLAALAGAASFLEVPDHYLADARRGPRLEVTLVAAAPPAFVIDAALRPMEAAVAAYSMRGARAYPEPGAPREAPRLPSESLYYSPRDVDVRAAPLTDIVPINPDLSGQESGVVVLRLLINASGAVDYAMVARAVPERPFGSGLLKPFREARFSAARKNGLPVNSEMLIELRYGDLAEPPPGRR